MRGMGGMSISKVFFKTRVKGVSNFGLCRFVYDRDPLSNMTVHVTKEKESNENLGQKDFQIIYQSETNLDVKKLFGKIIHHFKIRLFSEHFLLDSQYRLNVVQMGEF